MEDQSFYVQGILLTYIAFLFLVASPGPNVLCLMGTSMSVGRMAGIWYALGISTGTFTWAAMSVFGISALLTTYSTALYALKIVGGVYLIWLSFNAFRSSFSKQDIHASSLKNDQRFSYYFRTAYVVNMSKPKAGFGWVAIVSLSYSHESPIWVGFSVVLGTVLISIAVCSLYAILFSTPIMVNAYKRARRLIQGFMGLFLGVTGYKLLTTRGAA